MTLKQYRINVLLTLDQSANVILLGGYPDETISSHLFRKRDKHVVWAVAYRFVNWLFRDKEHCRNAYIAELTRKQNFKIQPHELTSYASQKNL